MKTLIFDFDGTLANSTVVYLDIINQLAQKYDRPLVTPAQFNVWKSLPLPTVLNQLGVPITQLPSFLAQAHQLFAQHLDQIELFTNIKPTLIKLAQVHNLGIVSSNRLENISTILAQNQIEDLFSFVHCEKNLFGKGKSLKRIVAQRRLDSTQTWYIGDEVRDIIAGHHANLSVVAVGWGLNDPAILTQHQPELIVNQVDELLNIPW